MIESCSRGSPYIMNWGLLLSVVWSSVIGDCKPMPKCMPKESPKGSRLQKPKVARVCGSVASPSGSVGCVFMSRP